MKIKEIISKFLRSLALISLLIICFCSNFSCSGKHEEDRGNTDFEIISDFFRGNYDFIIDDTIRQIVVITEKGCPSCNMNFVRFTLSHLNNENTCILVASDGTGLDISDLLTADGNIFFDYNLDPVEYEIFDSSKVIFFNDKEIDTIITINSFVIQEQFEFISGKVCENTDLKKIR